MLVAALIPLALLVGSGAGFVLDPRERGWLMHGDSAQHLVAWSFYAREPWHWPPASIERWPAPLGTTIGLADAIPLVAMPLKAIAGERAADLQYFGLWSALCLAALGATSALFLLEARGGPLLAALGGGLVALSPVVWDRLTRGHSSLAAHALLVGLFVAWLRYFRTGGSLRPIAVAGAIVVGAAAVHPYLLVMSAALLSAMVMFGALRFGTRSLMLSGAVVLAAMSMAAIMAWLGGFLDLPAGALAIGSLGGMESDLLSLLNASTTSRIVAPLFEGDQQREGFAWLGLGVVAIGVLGLVRRFSERRRAWTFEPEARGTGADAGFTELAIAVSVLGLLAVVPHVTVGGHSILDLSRALSRFELIFSWIRANGRLIWPLHLMAMLAAVLSLRNFEGRKIGLALVLVGGIGLQIVDSSPRLWAKRENDESPSRLAAALSADSVMHRDVQEFALVPAYLQSGSGIHCGGNRVSDRWIEPALIAARRGWRFNSGYLARIDLIEAERACAASTVEAVLETAQRDRLFLVTARQARTLSGNDDSRCSRIARNEWICRFAPGRSAGHTDSSDSVAHRLELEAETRSGKLRTYSSKLSMAVAPMSSVATRSPEWR